MARWGGLLIPPRDFAGRGTARSAVEGLFWVWKDPSTMLRMVPLPCKCRGGFRRDGTARKK
jgi:hypothetical protein